MSKNKSEGSFGEANKISANERLEEIPEEQDYESDKSVAHLKSKENMLQS